MKTDVGASEQEKPAWAQQLPWMRAAVAGLEQDIAVQYGEAPARARPAGSSILPSTGMLRRKAGAVGPEVKRMVVSGCVAPDLWMQRATGAPVGPDALLSAAARALDELEQFRN
jgi:hypothetical protein